jgi:translation elongation factor EF-G
VFREVAQKATMTALRQAQLTVLGAISICRIMSPLEYAIAVKEIAAKQGQIKSAQSEQQKSGVAVTVPSSGVGKLLQDVLDVTNGHARCSVESAGFRSKPEPPEAAEV